MRPSSAPVRRQGRPCSSTSRSSIIGSACTQPWAIALQLKPGPAWRRSLCARQHDILIASLHSQGGCPVEPTSGRDAARPSRLVQPMSTVSIPPILSLLISHIAAAVPRRARITFTELLIGAAATRGGHVTDAILAAGLSRSWTTYYWLLQRGRWTWLAVWQALLRVLKMLFDPPVWHVVLDDTLVERISARAPGSLIHYNHTAKPNRPRFLRGQGWLCLAAGSGAADAALGPPWPPSWQAQER